MSGIWIVLGTSVGTFGEPANLYTLCGVVSTSVPTSNVVVVYGCPLISLCPLSSKVATPNRAVTIEYFRVTQGIPTGRTTGGPIIWIDSIARQIRLGDGG